MEKAVCSPNMWGGLFTTAAADTIDHNHSSTSAHDSFHKNMIVPTHKQSIKKCSTYRYNSNQSHTTVPPLALGKHDIPVPLPNAPPPPPPQQSWLSASACTEGRNAGTYRRKECRYVQKEGMQVRTETISWTCTVLMLMYNWVREHCTW